MACLIAALAYGNPTGANASAASAATKTPASEATTRAAGEDKRVCVGGGLSGEKGGRGMGLRGAESRLVGL